MAAASDNYVNTVTLDPISMISWKLLAVFHDPIHDFGLNIDRMSSIVNYINHLKDLIYHNEHVNPSEPSFIGGGKKIYSPDSTIGTLYLEERNIGFPHELHPDEAHIPMHKLYRTLYSNYIDQRAFYNSKCGTTLTGWANISIEENATRVYRLQLYNQFFTNITKLIDLFKLLIVIQVVENHPPHDFQYNNVNKLIVLSAFRNLLTAIEEEEEGESQFSNINELKDDLCLLLRVMEILFNTMSSIGCTLQLDLLNSSTFNNLVRIYFSCFFYDKLQFQDVFKDMAHRVNVFYEEETEENDAYNFSRDTVYEYEVNGFGGGRKRQDSRRPFILKGGAVSGKALKWQTTKVSDPNITRIFIPLMNQWCLEKRSGDVWITDASYNDAIVLFESLKQCESGLKSNFPILYSKMNKDINYHKLHCDKREDFNIRPPLRNRTTPKFMVITTLRNYMNELVSEVRALEAEIDNQTKRLEAEPQEFAGVKVDTNITNRVSKLFAKKGLQYAMVALSKLAALPDEEEEEAKGLAIKYINEIIEKTYNNKSVDLLPVVPSTVRIHILFHHIKFLGFVYLADKKCLPDIDGKLLTCWSELCNMSFKDYIIQHSDVMDKKVIKRKFGKTTLRVINNGIPSVFKSLFDRAEVSCPTSSVCDSMGNFGSCAGTKRKNEFYGMGINIIDTDGGDFYNVYSKIKNVNILNIISNNFNLDFGGGPEMFIEATYGNVNLNEKPEMLSANNVFRQTLDAIEICFREAPSMSVDDLWIMLESNENFKRIITPTCLKATGDINQEFNSIVNNGGYNSALNQSVTNTINNVNLTLGLAGDRPSAVRMILLALCATNRGELLPSFVVGYANLAHGLYVYRPPDHVSGMSLRLKKIEKAGAAGAAVATGRGGRIRKTKFRKPKMIKTRKNKSHHYKMISKRRKYNNNKTKNRKQ